MANTFKKWEDKKNNLQILIYRGERVGELFQKFPHAPSKPFGEKELFQNNKVCKNFIVRGTPSHFGS
jgi:hypothetical protein